MNLKARTNKTNTNTDKKNLILMTTCRFQILNLLNRTHRFWYMSSLEHGTESEKVPFWDCSRWWKLFYYLLLMEIKAAQFPRSKSPRLKGFVTFDMKTTFFWISSGGKSGGGFQIIKWWSKLRISLFCNQGSWKMIFTINRPARARPVSNT